jgi:hypothetical protein
MPLAKSSEQTTAPKTSINPPPPTGIAAFEWQSVPIDVFRHFSVPLETVPAKDIEKLKDITDWAKSRTADEPSIGNILQQISKVQRELGSPAINEKAYDKVWRFIKAQKVIDEMTKRQDSLRSSPWV